MLAVLVKRTIQAGLSALAATIIVWLILPLAPGDPANRIFIARGIDDATEGQLAALRQEMGLNLPLPQQFLRWFTDLMHGDLGLSFTTGRPVLQDFLGHLPPTLMMLGLALLLSTLATILLSLLAVMYHNRWPDKVIALYTEITAALPTFVFALLALNYVVVGWQFGRVIADVSWTAALMPAFIIGLDRAGGWIQLLRASLLAEMADSYAFVAKSRGASDIRILLRHALPNSLKPLLSAIGLSVGALLGGAPLIEAIFSWPGVGSYLLSALTARDYPVIQAYVLIAALGYVVAAFLVDVAIAMLDPRLREVRT
ncbi:ABC transporter permease [uncultured Cohaesibacter sp.]|uniref:ABC transporter permease n=1 Tax=uncultured Cohaesibacter sp. TaxID=1002546 RepID=UPI00292FE7BE|nr:ABC transporter permease [uncultured Cohaesibacter sp.]